MGSSPSKSSEEPPSRTPARRMEGNKRPGGNTAAAATGVMTRSRTKITSVTATASVAISSSSVNVRTISVAAKSPGRSARSGHAVTPHAVRSMSTSTAPYVLIPTPERHGQSATSRGRSPRAAKAKINLSVPLNLEVGDHESTTTEANANQKKTIRCGMRNNRTEMGGTKSRGGSHTPNTCGAGDISPADLVPEPHSDEQNVAEEGAVVANGSTITPKIAKKTGGSRTRGGKSKSEEEGRKKTRKNQSDDPKEGNFYECPICMEDLKPPIYQCHNGHLVCSSCELKINRCAECREEMPTTKIRNRFLENLVSSSTTTSSAHS